MPPATLPYEEAAKAVKLVQTHGAVATAARAADIPRSTLRKRLSIAEREYNLRVDGQDYDTPEIVDSGKPIEELIAERKRAFDRRARAAASRNWPIFSLRENKPFGLAFVGDPHMDDNGCNWTALEAHVEFLRETPGLYGIGMGDYSNNWIGKLQQKYANQEVTQDDAWRLAEWFFNQRKPNNQSIWWLLLKGNHDAWSSKRGGGDPLDWMMRQDALLEDWRFKFKAQLPDGQQFKFDTAHDFKGHSQWNTLHANQKTANMGEHADFYVSAHKHNWAMAQMEDQYQAGRIYHLIRVRGYKHFDEYAEHLGFGDQHYGASITAVIDPSKQGPSRIQTFAEMADAVDWLNFLRR